MKALFIIGVVLVILGIASLVIPIPHNEEKGFHAGGVSVGVETTHKETVSPAISAVLIVGGVLLLVAQKLKK
jgi:hypothetical protein